MSFYRLSTSIFVLQMYGCHKLFAHPFLRVKLSLHNSFLAESTSVAAFSLGTFFNFSFGIDHVLRSSSCQFLAEVRNIHI